MSTCELNGAVEKVERGPQEVARLHVVGQVEAGAVERTVAAGGRTVVRAVAGDGAFVASDAGEGFLGFVEPGFAEAWEGC